MLRKLRTQGSTHYIVKYEHFSHPRTEEQFDTYDEELLFHEKNVNDPWCLSSVILCIEVMDAYNQRCKALERPMFESQRQ